MIPRGKRPAIANGHLKATVDKDFLTETFKPYGRPFNIGIVPGLGGLFVLDVDRRTAEWRRCRAEPPANAES